MVSEDSTCTVLLRARCLLLLLLPADNTERRCAVCGITFKISCNLERKQKNDFVPTRTRKNPTASKTHPHQKAFFCVWKLSIWTCELDPHERRKCDTLVMAIVHPTEHPRTSPSGSRGSEHLPRHPSCGCLSGCSVSQAMATSARKA